MSELPINQIILGDNLEVMRTWPNACVDAIVTDPPYGLSFMGKKWDYDVPSVECWAECLRVLKPGGHLLAFAGTRTQHRMAVRIEDAGFEIRDMIAWVYGSGFPKSLDIGKAIDKMDAGDEQQLRRYRFTEWIRSQGVTSKQIDEATQTNMGGHYTTAASQPAIMTREHLEACRHLFSDVPEWVEAECDIRSVESKNFAAREVVGTRGMIDTTKARAGFAGESHSPGYDGSKREVNITAPATEAAKQWDGWGSAIKPALEPITMARKPLDGTIAGNVLKHGVGGINVDACRVVSADVMPKMSGKSILGGTSEGWDRPWKNNAEGLARRQAAADAAIDKANQLGRFPANLIHDGSDEVVGLFPETGASSVQVRNQQPREAKSKGAENARTGVMGHDDSGGSAARFFYCAKADATERRQSNHPTVKPIALMRYLVRMVTPIGAIVLDPFAGSGTTLEAAKLESCRYIGIELSAEYVADCKERLRQKVLF